MEYLIGYAIGLIIWGFIWGFATKKVIENKGYSEDWFLWGFIFGFIAFIVALTKPECQRDYRQTQNLKNTEAVSSPTPPKDSWQCICKTYHPSYVTSCPNCGRTLNEVKKSLRSTDWRCKCGALNTVDERTCHRCNKPYVSPYQPQTQTETSSQNDDTKSQSNVQTSKNEEEIIKCLKRYKELLDSGVISQEEFDAKKKQLLGF